MVLYFSVIKNKENICAVKRPESVALSKILYIVYVTWNEENMQNWENFKKVQLQWLADGRATIHGGE